MNPLSILWNDRMDVYRHEEYEDNGIDKSREVLVCSNIKCKYSKGSTSLVGTGVPNIDSTHALFCDTKTDINEGDRVVVTQLNGNIITLSVGEGFPYTNHIEFKVKRSDTV